MNKYQVKLTDEQVKAVEAAFPVSCEMTFSDKLRALIAGGLSLQEIEWPETPTHGGQRNGAGRKKIVTSANVL